MPLVDSESLLRPISDSDPAGPNLEYDSAFANLERSLAGKAEQQIGDVLIPAEEPDWNAVQRLCLDLLGRTKDLRVACPLVRSLLMRNGLVGMDEGLAVVRAIVDRYWDRLHPQLDPDDDNDPTTRINTVAALSAPDAIQALRGATLVQSRAMGPVAVRDCIAALQGSAEGARLDAASVDAALQEVALEELEGVVGTCDRIVEHLRGIDAAFEEHAAGRGPDLSKLTQVVGQLVKFLRPRVAARRPDEGTADGANGTAANGSSAQGGVTMRVPGELRSREDVVRVLDKICDYYQKYEPSSPIPLLLSRCKRLVSMNFLDIIRDLAPDGLPQAETVTGSKRES
jgi:type VI secretion system protein ImpA